MPINLDNSLNRNMEYLVQSKSRIESFINKNKISFVIGEITWAIEILIFQICKKFQ